MMRRVGWIRMLGLLCAGVCAGPGMLAQNPTGHKNASTSGTVHQQQPSQAAQRQAPAATAKTSQATAQTQQQQRAAQPSPAANTQKPPTNVYTRPAASVQPNGMETTTPARSSTAPVQTQSPGMYTYQQPPARTSTTGRVFPAGRHEESAFAWGFGRNVRWAGDEWDEWIQVAAVEREPAVFGRERKWRTGDWRVRAAGRFEETAFEWECGWDFWRNLGWAGDEWDEWLEWLEGSAVGRESTEIGGNLGWVAVERTEVAGHEAAAAVVDRYLCATASTS